MIDALFLLYPRWRFICHWRIVSERFVQSKNASKLRHLRVCAFEWGVIALQRLQGDASACQGRGSGSPKKPLVCPEPLTFTLSPIARGKAKERVIGSQAGGEHNILCQARTRTPSHW